MPLITQEQADAGTPLVPQPVAPATPQAAKPPPSALDVTAAAFRQSNILSSVFDRAANEGPQTAPQPGYDPFGNGGEDIKGYEDYAHRFVDAESPEQVQAIKNRISSELSDKETLSRADGWGYTASMAAGAVDPISLSLMLLPGVGEVAGAGRLARIAAVVGTNVAGGEAQQAALAANSETTGYSEGIISRIGVNALLGSVLGGLATRIPRAELDALAARTETRLGAPESSTAGAAAVPQTTLEDEAVARGGRGLAKTIGQVSPSTRIFSDSKVPEARRLAQQLVDPGILLEKNFKGEATLPSVEMKVNQQENVRNSQLFRKFDTEFADYKQTGGELSKTEFSAAVADAMRNSDTHEIPQVKNVAQFARPMFQGDRSVLAEMGAMKEGEDVTGAPSYFPRVYDQPMIAANRTDIEKRLYDWFKVTPKTTVAEVTGDAKLSPETLQDAQAAREAAVKPHQEALDAAMKTANEAHAAVVQPAREVRETAKKEARAARDAVIKPATESRDTTIKASEDARDEAIRKADDKYYESLKGPGEEGYVEARRAANETRDKATKEAKDLHDRVVTVAKETHEAAIQKAKDEFKTSLKAADEAHDAAVQPARDARKAAVKEANEKFAEAKKAAIEQADKAREAAARPGIPVYRDPAEIKASVHETLDHIQGITRGVADIGQGVSHPAFLKGRALDVPDSILKPYLSHDFEHVMMSYNHAILPQIEMRRSFGTPDLADQFREVSDAYHKEIENAGSDAEKQALQEQHAEDLNNLTLLRDRVMNQTGPKGNESLALVRSAQLIRSFNYLRTLGGQTLSAIPDIGRLVGRYGLVNTSHRLTQFLTGATAGLSRADAQRMGTACDVALHTRQHTLDGIGDELAGSQLSQGMKNATATYTKLTGIASWDAMMRVLSSQLEQDAIFRAITKDNISSVEMAKLASHGIGTSELGAIKAQWLEHGSNEFGLNRARTELWTDKGAAERVEGAVQRAASSTAFFVGKGDLPGFTSSQIGKMLVQFKAFAISSVNRMTIPLAQGVAHGDIKAANGIMSLMALGGMSYYVKEIAAGRKPDMSPGALIPNAIQRSGLLTYVPDLYDPVAGTFHMPRFAKFQDLNPLETAAGPSFGTAATLLETVRRMTDGNVTASDMHKLRQMLPYQNLFYFNRLINMVEGKTADAVGAAGASDRPALDYLNPAKDPETKDVKNKGHLFGQEAIPNAF